MSVSSAGLSALECVGRAIRSRDSIRFGSVRFCWVLFCSIRPSAQFGIRNSKFEIQNSKSEIRNSNGSISYRGRFCVERAISIRMHTAIAISIQTRPCVAPSRLIRRDRANEIHWQPAIALALTAGHGSNWPQVDQRSNCAICTLESARSAFNWLWACVQSALTRLRSHFGAISDWEQQSDCIALLRIRFEQPTRTFQRQTSNCWPSASIGQRCSDSHEPIAVQVSLDSNSNIRLGH